MAKMLMGLSSTPTFGSLRQTQFARTPFKAWPPPPESAPSSVSNRFEAIK
jgi:hypothetical protein